jgi:hypothetical protein
MVRREWRYSCTHSYLSALDGVDCWASRSGNFTPRKYPPLARGVWVGPRASLDPLEKIIIPWPWNKLKNDSSLVQPVASTLQWLPYSSIYWNIECFRKPGFNRWNRANATNVLHVLFFVLLPCVSRVLAMTRYPFQGAVLSARTISTFLMESC